MKTVIKEREKEDMGYPCLKIHKSDKLIVLFSKIATGTVLTKCGEWNVGYQGDNWNESNFIPFNGTVELSND